MLEESFKVRHSEMDAHNRVPVWVLQSYFQEAAAVDAGNLSFGWEEFSRKGIAWVITKIQFKFFKEVKNLQPLKIKTWHHLGENVQCRRDFIIYDGQGDIAAKGISWWVIIDLEKRKIVRVPRELISLNASNPPAVMEGTILKNPDFAAAAPLTTVPVIARLEDIDCNGHVNNTHFCAWALAGVPKQIYDSKELDDVFINFKAEVMLGDEITVNTYADGGNAYWHILKRAGDGKEIASVRTSWR